MDEKTLSIRYVQLLDIYHSEQNISQETRLHALHEAEICLKYLREAKEFLLDGAL